MLSIRIRSIFPQASCRRLLLTSRTAAVAVNAAPKNPVILEPTDQVGRQAIITLDRELRRFGRIRTDHYTNALNDVVEQKFLTSQHAVLLLRSLGSALSDESPAVRVDLAKTLWHQLESLGVKPDVGLFNALLQTYIENDHFEPPSVILEKMKANNVTPNKVTYQRIIGLYCLKGDINAASTVLNHMKSEGHPVNEMLFAHLIHGHIRAGDVDGAKSIFETMRKAGIEPTAASFSMLMLGFAERGDLEAIKNARKLAADSNCLLLPRDFIPSIISLAQKGHSEKIPSLLELITNHVGYNRDMMAAILQLSSMKKFSEAISIFWTLRRPSPVSASQIFDESGQSQNIAASEHVENASSNSPMLFGRFLVRSLIKHRAPIDLVITTMQQMRDRNVNSDTALDGARIVAEFGRADQFREWLRRIRSDELVKPSLRQHMFWPLFRMLSRATDSTTDAVVDVIKEMKAMGVNFDHNSFVTISEFVLPAFAQAVGGDKNLATSNQGVLAKLELAGYQSEHISFSWLVYLARRGLLAEAKSHLSQQPNMLVSPAYLSEYFAGLMRTSESSLAAVVDVLSLLEKNKNVENPDNIELLVGRTLIEAIFARKSAEWPAKVIEAFANAGLKPSSGSVRAARVELERRNSSKELLSQLDKIAASRTQSDAVSKGRSRTTATEDSIPIEENMEADELDKMSAEQLESALSKAREMQRPTLRIEKYLLMRYCQNGDIEKADQLKAKLDSRNFVYPPSMLRALLTLAAAHKQSLDESLVVKDKLESVGGLASPGATIDIVALQARAGKLTVESVLDTLRDYANRQSAMLNRRQMGQSMLLYKPASRLLQAFVDIGQHKAAAQAMLGLIECGFISPRCQVLGDICVNAFVTAKDWDGLVDLVETMARKHNTVIAANDVLSALIRAGDDQKAKLQRCIDCMSSCQGEMATLNALIVSLVECDRLNEARKVLETPGLRALPRYLSWACENLASKGRYEAILSLSGVVRGLYNADVEDMYFRLIKAYGRPQSSEKAGGASETGWKKAISVYERFEEESIQPRPRTLRYLADILKDNGQPIPFEVPAITPRQDVPLTKKTGADNKQMTSEDGSSVAILKHVRRAIELLSRGKTEDVLAIRSQLDRTDADHSGNADGADAHKSLGTTFVRLLVQQLIDKHSHDLLVKLSSSLASSGTVDDLMLIRDIAGSKSSQPLPDWCWEKLSVDLISTYERSGHTDNYVKMLNAEEVSITNLRRSLSPAALSLLQKSSSSKVWNDIEQIVRRSATTLNSHSNANDPSPSNVESMSLLNRYWTTCVLTNDLQRAKRLESDFPQLLERPPLAGILRQVKSLPLQTEAVPIFDHLLSSFKDRSDHAAFVLSYALPMLATEGDWAAIRQRVTAMTAAGIPPESLRPFAVAQLQQAAEQGHADLPPEIARLPKQTVTEKSHSKQMKAESAPSDTNSDMAAKEPKQRSGFRQKRKFETQVPRKDNKKQQNADS